MDVGPDIDSVELAVRTALEKKTGVHLHRIADRLEVLSDADDTRIGYVAIASDDRPTIFTDVWHGHFETAEKLSICLVFILASYSVQMREYKGDKLSATYLLTYVGSSYMPSNVAYYLHPLNPDEWVLAPGEGWSTVSTRWTLIDAAAEFLACYPDSNLDQRRLPPGVAQGSSRKPRDIPYIAAARDCFAWYEDKLGKPLPGMRWSWDAQSRFFFQVPSYWIDWELPSDVPVTAFKANDSETMILIHTMFRDSEPPRDFTQLPVRYSTIETNERTNAAGGIEWSETVWAMAFTNGAEDLAAWLTLRRPVSEGSEADLLPLKAKLSEALKDSVFANLDL